MNNGFNDAAFSALRGFQGIVEDIDDPKKLGRVRVRVFALHTNDKEKIPTNKLPWSQILMPSNSASISGVGMSPTGIKKGSWVVGIFFDGDSFQSPLVLGTLQGEPDIKVPSSEGFSDPSGMFPKYLNESDVSGIARGTEKAKNKLPDPTIGLPSNNANTKYPENFVITTEGGHIIELDDSSGFSRINIQHSSGSFIEIHNDGSIVQKSQAGSYVKTVGNLGTHVGGDDILVVDGSVNEKISLNYEQSILGQLMATASSISLTATSTFGLTAASTSVTSPIITLTGNVAVAGALTIGPMIISSVGAVSLGSLIVPPDGNALLRGSPVVTVGAKVQVDPNTGVGTVIAP